MKYREKPIIVEAEKVTEFNDKELRKFCPVVFNPQEKHVCYVVRTPKGNMRAELNDYIVKMPNGDFYPCNGKIFETNYEKVE